MDAQEVVRRVTEAYFADDLCEHDDIVDEVEELADENKKLKLQRTVLCNCLRDDFGLDVRWDDADEVWSIKLTEEGVRERFERENEVAKLREHNELLKKKCEMIGREYARVKKQSDEYFARSCEAATNSMGQIGTLRDKNVELKKLVKDMCKAFVYGNCYQWCEPKEPCDYITDGTCQWCERMQELGIEVDG